MNITKTLLASLVALLSAYDVFAYSQWGSDGTISWVVFSAFRDYPILALAVGSVIGHLAWPLTTARYAVLRHVGDVTTVLSVHPDENAAWQTMAKAKLTDGESGYTVSEIESTKKDKS